MPMWSAAEPKKSAREDPIGCHAHGFAWAWGRLHAHAKQWAWHPHGLLLTADNHLIDISSRVKAPVASARTTGSGSDSSICRVPLQSGDLTCIPARQRQQHARTVGAGSMRADSMS